ncbi:hypothetical protein MMC26_001046 [Xylographa opegraphella]|nr:hypothetical protein [Xylographa opegraphella]
MSQAVVPPVPRLERFEDDEALTSILHSQLPKGVVSLRQKPIQDSKTRPLVSEAAGKRAEDDAEEEPIVDLTECKSVGHVVREAAVEPGIDEGLEDFLAVDKDRESGMKLVMPAGVGKIACGEAEDAFQRFVVYIANGFLFQRLEEAVHMDTVLIVV